MNYTETTKRIEDMTPEEFAAHVQKKRVTRMRTIDDLPASSRSLVHEYGFNLVNQFALKGITNPATIRHLVELVLCELSPTHGAYSAQGISPPRKESKP